MAAPGLLRGGVWRIFSGLLGRGWAAPPARTLRQVVEVTEGNTTTENTRAIQAKFSVQDDLMKARVKDFYLKARKDL